MLVTRFLNAVAIIVVITPALTTTFTLTQTAQQTRSLQSRFATIQRITLARPENPLDIYYIIVDGYGRADILQDYFGYDNRKFVDFLTSKGFYVAAESRANYMQTALSLSSAFGMDYLNFLGNDMKDSQNRGPLTVLFHDSPVRASLEEAGYQFITIASPYLLSQIRNADQYLSCFSSPATEFEALLLSTTIAGVFIEDFHLDFPLPNYETHRAFIRCDLQLLPEVAAMSGPKFVFVHILAPHPPFVFDGFGNPIQPDRPYFIADATGFNGTRAEYILGYTGELTFLNTGLTEMLTGILENSVNPPLIIIQGDHGPGSMTSFISPDETCLRERFSILNAYYFPDQNYADLYPAITPVNSFRVIFNTYFRTDL